MAESYSARVVADLKRRPAPVTARLLRHWLRTFAASPRKECAVLDSAIRSGCTAVPVPAVLVPPPYRYVDYGGPWIEDSFFHFYLGRREQTALRYLPIRWAAVYQNIQTMNFLPADGDAALAAIERILRRELDPSQRYFTILDYDHAIWDWHLFPKNVLVFSAGGAGDVPIPWLKGSPPLSNPEKDIRVSFMGRLDGASDAGGVRSRMHAALKDDAHFGFGPEWRDVMARSTFSLSPRGLGRASYRLYEALSVSSIPIYVWDDVEWLPYRDELDWENFCISVNIDRAAELPQMIANWDDDRVTRAHDTIARHYGRYFTLDGVCERIVEMANRFADPGRFETAIAERRLF